MFAKLVRHVCVCIAASAVLSLGAVAAVPGAPTVAHAATIADCAGTVLGIGSTGPCVAVLQQALDDEQAKLTNQGYHLQVDGHYGQQTARAVDAWENYAFLQSRNDHLAGPEVWASLQAPSGCKSIGDPGDPRHPGYSRKVK